MPGPLSVATTLTPLRGPRRTVVMQISPRSAYVVMFRAISEIAVASSVRSVPVNPSPEATSRALERATTTPSSDSTGTRISSATVVALLQQRVQVVEALLDIQGAVDALQAPPA